MATRSVRNVVSQSAGVSTVTTVASSTLPECKHPTLLLKNAKSKPKYEWRSYEVKIKCAICGDRASGFHYGVYACEGCKGFFRRTVRLKSKYKECSSNCPVTIKSRNKCQYCRFSKCIKLGMSQNAIRFGRRSKLEKEKIMREIDEERPLDLSQASVQIEDKFRKLIDILLPAFQKLTLTHTKMKKLWDERNQTESRLTMIESFEDFLSMHPNTNMKEDSASTSSASETSGSPCYPACQCLREGKIFQTLDCFNTDVSIAADFKDIILLLHKYTEPKFFQSLLKSGEQNEEYVHQQKVTIEKIAFLLNNVPEIGVGFRHAGITETDIQNHATEHGKSLLEAFIYIMRDMHVHTRIEVELRGTGSALMHVLKKSRKQNMHPIFLTRAHNRTYAIELMRYFYQATQQQVANCVRELSQFAKCIPGFLQLTLDDQVILLKFACLEAIPFLLSCTIFSNGTIIPGINVHVTYDFLKKLDYMGEFPLPMLRFAEKIADMGLSDEELAVVISTVILSRDRPGLKCPDNVEQLQTNVVSALEALIKFNHPKRPFLFPKLLLKLAEVRHLTANHISMSCRLRHAGFMAWLYDPLISELLKGQ